MAKFWPAANVFRGRMAVKKGVDDVDGRRAEEEEKRYEAWRAEHYRDHMAEGPKGFPGEARLMGEIEDARNFGLYDRADDLKLDLRELRARWGPVIWRDHIEDCREAGFYDLAKRFQAELAKKIPEWQEELKAVNAERAMGELADGLEWWREAVPQKEMKPMRQEQIAREMAEARKIQEGIMARVAAKTQEAVDKLRESPLAEWYGKAQEALKGPIADINRRVVEEPWFNKPVTDVLYNQQQREDKSTVDMEPEKQDKYMDRFYGRQQTAEQG